MQQGLWPVCYEQQHLRSFISGDCVTVSALQCQLGEESEETQMVGGGDQYCEKINIEAVSNDVSICKYFR